MGFSPTGRRKSSFNGVVRTIYLLTLGQIVVTLHNVILILNFKGIIKHFEIDVLEMRQSKPNYTVSLLLIVSSQEHISPVIYFVLSI